MTGPIMLSGVVPLGSVAFFLEFGMYIILLDEVCHYRGNFQISFAEDTPVSQLSHCIFPVQCRNLSYLSSLHIAIEC